MIKAASILEPGDIIDVTGVREVVTSVEVGPNRTTVYTDRGHQYELANTRATRTQQMAPREENPQLEQYRHDQSLYTSDLEERVRRLEAANERLRALAEVVARGNTDADELADMAKRELNR